MDNQLLQRLLEIVPSTHKTFVEILGRTNRAVYDWGWDILWVWEDKGENDKDNPLSMSGELLQGILSVIDPNTNLWPTSAGFVVRLLSLGISVQIAIQKKDWLPWHFLQDYRHQAHLFAKDVKPGGLSQFVAKYKED